MDVKHKLRQRRPEKQSFAARLPAFGFKSDLKPNAVFAYAHGWLTKAPSFFAHGAWSRLNVVSPEKPLRLPVLWLRLAD